MYSFRYSSLSITAPKCLRPDQVIFTLVLSNISAAFDSYSSLAINIVLLGFGKYAVSITSLRWSNYQQKLPFKALFQNNKSLGVSGVALMLFHKLLSHRV